MFRFNISQLAFFVAMIALLSAVLPIVIMAYAAPKAPVEIGTRLPGGILEQQGSEAMDAIDSGTVTLSDEDIVITVFLHESGDAVDMTMREYLCAVLMAEVPYSFDSEALCAMAVAARSYALYKIKNSEHYLHAHEAVICSDYAHCMAYLSLDGASERWGESWAEMVYPKMLSAVIETDKKVLCYDGEIINALFHAISSTYTASAESVWGYDVPYLQSVESPEPSDIDGFFGESVFSIDEFCRRLADDCKFFGGRDEYIGECVRDSSGRVQKILICGTEIAGVRIRELFGLRSANFEVSLDGDTVVFSTEGYGHGVGMSQYGASEMAKEGFGAGQILEQYYSGAKVQDLCAQMLD